MKTVLEPLDDRVVVRRIDESSEKIGTLFIPEMAREKPQTGEIVAAGPGRILENGKRAPLTLGVGDRVFYGKYSGIEITIDAEQLLILRESEVLARFSQPENTEG
jgi:chaperonin GroES